MTNALVLHNKKLLPIRDASSSVSYSKDYITRLAREGKVTATWVGRQWFVDVESLKAYEVDAHAEQQLRQQRLSEERKRESELRAKLTSQASDLVVKKARAPRRALATVGFAMLGGLVVMAGVIQSFGVYTAPQSRSQVASLAETSRASVAAQLPSEAVMPHFTLPATSTTATTTGLVMLPMGAQEAEGFSAEQFLSDYVVTRTNSDGSVLLVAVDARTGEESVMPVIPIPLQPGTVISNVSTEYE